MEPEHLQVVHLVDVVTGQHHDVARLLAQPGRRPVSRIDERRGPRTGVCRSAARRADNHVYTLLRLGRARCAGPNSRRCLMGARLPLLPAGERLCIFTLLVVCWCVPTDQATLHFFWLCVAFFGVLAFSFSGRLDRVDWPLTGRCCRAVAAAAPVPAFRAGVPRTAAPRGLCRAPVALAAGHLPAGRRAGLHRILVLIRAAIIPDCFVRLVGMLDCLELCTSRCFSPRALFVSRAETFAVGDLQAQLRWIVWYDARALRAGLRRSLRARRAFLSRCRWTCRRALGLLNLSATTG